MLKNRNMQVKGIVIIADKSLSSGIIIGVDKKQHSVFILPQGSPRTQRNYKNLLLSVLSELCG